MRPIRFNAGLPNGDFTVMTSLAKRAEELGFDSVSVDDHFFMRGLMADPRQPRLECYLTLSAIAAMTTTIKLVPLVTAMSFRNPALLAKMMATLDVISRGRLIAGLGAGWFKDEYVSYNYPYPSNAVRIDQLAEGVALLKHMWTEDEPTFHGRYFAVDQAFCFPRPVQKPHPPILIGGGGKPILKVAAAQADILNLNPPITDGSFDPNRVAKFDREDLKRRLAMVAEFVRDAGRSMDTLELSAMSFVLIAREKSVADAMIAATAQAMGIADAARAAKSPAVLAGTIHEVKRELAWRIEHFGMTYFFLNFIAPDAMELFAKEVMPAFR